MNSAKNTLKAWLKRLAYLALIAFGLGFSVMRYGSTGQGSGKRSNSASEITELEDGTVRLDRLSYDFDLTSLEIPGTVKNKTVTVLGENVMNISALIDQSFKVSKSGIVTVKASPVETVTIPASVTKIEGNPFDSCPSLREFIVPEDNPVFTVQEGMLIDREAGQVVVCPRGLDGSVTLPDGIKVIGKDAFRNCSINEIVLPDGLEEIQEHAFYGCDDLKQIEIPDTVKIIGKDAFEGCGNPVPGYYAMLGNGMEVSSYPFKIIGSEGSAAQAHADETGLPFEAR